MSASSALTAQTMLAGLLAGLLSPGLAPRASSALRSRAGASRLSGRELAGGGRREGRRYVGSYGTPREMPFLPLPEICLAGRSNVGKSSCLNALSGRRKKVAVASKQPGRTRLLNLFRVGRACAITDLPGYGFAKVSRDMQDSWKKNIEGYMKRREQLRLSVLLVDAQREPSELDASLLDFLAYYEVPTLVVATKTDKLKPAQLDASLAALADALELPEGQPLPFSAVTKDGRKELWNAIQAQASAEKLR